MTRSIFILFLMLQCTKSSYGIEIIPGTVYGENESNFELMSVDENDEGSVEELTTLMNDVTEVPPPIFTPPTSSLETFNSSSFVDEATESSVEAPTEPPLFEEKTTEESKKKSGRLLEAKSEEILLKPEVRSDETMEILPDDTTSFPDSEGESNETNNLDLTTIQPPPSKKPKIYKTRPNELLKLYVEDSHLRSPVAALIDKKTNPLMKAKRLWKAALKPNSLLDIMVVSYDSEGEFA